MSDYNKKIIKPGDELSKLAFKVNKGSYKNSAALEIFPDVSGDFRGDSVYVPMNHISELMMQKRETKNGPRPVMSWAQGNRWWRTQTNLRYNVKKRSHS